jgi:hypothetical protein
LGQVYKQINAPVGQLGRAGLAVSTAALASDSDNDEVYRRLEHTISQWTARRNAIVGQMKAMLEGAAFGGQPISERQAQQLIRQGNQLLQDAASCAASLPDCGD